MNGALSAGAGETVSTGAELGERYCQPVQHGFELFTSFRGCPPILASQSMPGSEGRALPLKGLPAERGASGRPLRAGPEDEIRRDGDSSSTQQ